jgi:hypothetical protein
MRLVFLLFMVFCLKGFSQTPQAINYQGILRNASGQAIPNKQVKIRVSVSTNLVVDNSSSVYTEEISAKTNEFGIYNVAIGKGKATKGTFNSISWGTNKYWVLIELDENLTNKFEFAGSMELASVPYALYAEKAKNVDNPVPGPAGPQGPQGIQGIKGDKGDKGDTGPAGANGAQGPQGLQGIKGDTGPAGANGANGPQGLQGIKGDKGDTGATGPQGPIGLTGPAGPAGGPQGPIGLTGPQGIAGANGKSILNGTINPSVSIGSDGDFYINTSTNVLFGPKLNGSWNNGISLRGPQGLQGAQGPQGLTGTQGIQGPQGLTGAQGIQGPQGLAGIDGRTILNGRSDPANNIGSNGDFYINTSTSYFFGPKSNGSWPQGISLIGPSGADTQMRRSQTLNYINN